MSGQVQTHGQVPDTPKLEEALEHAEEFLKALDTILDGLELDFADGALETAYSPVKANIHDRGMHAYVLLEIANYMLRNMPDHIAEYLENIRDLVVEAIEDLKSMISTMEQGGGE